MFVTDKFITNGIFDMVDAALKKQLKEEKEAKDKAEKEIDEQAKTKLEKQQQAKLDSLDRFLVNQK